MVRAFKSEKRCPRCTYPGIVYKLQKGNRWYYYVYHGKDGYGRSIIHYAGPVDKYVYHAKLRTLLEKKKEER